MRVPGCEQGKLLVHHEGHEEHDGEFRDKDLLSGMRESVLLQIGGWSSW